MTDLTRRELNLACHANDDGHSTPSNPEFPFSSELSERTVRNALAHPTKQVLIMRAPRFWEDSDRPSDGFTLQIGKGKP